MALLKLVAISYILAVFAAILNKADALDLPQCGGPEDVVQPVRGNDRISNKGLVALYQTAFFFIDDIVHTSDLRYMADRGVDFSDPDNILDSLQYHWQTWIGYWVGYLIMACIGVFLLLVMTIGGFCTCCCRCCCGKCRPSPYSKKKDERCQRVCCGTSLLILMILCMFGGICMILTTLDLMQKIDTRKTNSSMYRDFARAFDNLQVYLDDSVDDINCTALGSYVSVKDEVFEMLDGMANNSFDAIDEKVGATQTLTSLSSFTSRLAELDDKLTESENTTTELVRLRGELTNELATANTSAWPELQKCVNETSCSDMLAKLSNLQVQVDYSNFNFTAIEVAVRVLIDANVDGSVNNGLAEIDNAKVSISKEVDGAIDKSKDYANDIEVEIKKFIKDLNDTLDETDLSGIADTLKNVDVPGWIWNLVQGLLLAASCVVLLIAVLTYMGLINGLCCAIPGTTKDKCDTTIQAANWLKSAVAFIFIFYWIFMIVVIVVFVAGGIVHNDACRHVVKLNDSPITPLIDDVVSSYIDELPANLSDIYTSCGNNEALYTALRADEIAGLNITELLDLTPLKDAIEEMKGVTIDIGTIDLLPGNVGPVLNESDMAISYFLVALQTYDEELQKDILSNNITINDIITELNHINKSEFTDVDLNQAISEFEVANTTMSAMLSQISLLHSYFQTISEILHLVNLSSSVGTIENGEAYLNTEGNADIGKAINTTADTIYYDFEFLARYLDVSTRTNVSNCFPVYQNVLILVDTSCVDVIYPLNGFWLALGYTLILFIPIIFITFRLINLYSASEDAKGSNSDPNPQPDYGFDDEYAKRFNAANTKVAAANAVATEMAPMANPVYLSDEGLRNGYRNSVAPVGPYAYPGYDVPSSTNQNRQPGVVRYTGGPAYQNYGYDGPDAETSFASIPNQYEPLTSAYTGNQSGVPRDNQEKRNSALKFGVQVFPSGADVPRAPIATRASLPEPSPGQDDFAIPTRGQPPPYPSRDKFPTYAKLPKRRKADQV